MAVRLERNRSLGKQEEKQQMGCVAALFQLFDRRQILTGKRIGWAKRDQSSPIADTTTSSESERSAASSASPPAKPRRIGEEKAPYCLLAPPNPVRSKQKPPTTEELRSTVVAVAESPSKSPIRPLPVFELRDGGGSSWRFWKEAPRLSLDSRATTDAKGGLHPKQIRTGASILSAADGRDGVTSDVASDESQHHRSPSVVVRLMGLEPFPDSNIVSEPQSTPELRRSASESRLSREISASRLIADRSNPSNKQPTKTQSTAVKANQPMEARYSDPRSYSPNNTAAAESRKPFRRGSFDSEDFFSEPKQKASLYEEVENRLRMRGVSEDAEDLETLKQILEALHLKGLLRSRKPPEQNRIKRRSIIPDASTTVVTTPSRLPASSPINRRTRSDSSATNVPNQRRGLRHNSIAGENSAPPSPKLERNIRSPTRRAGERQSNSPVKPKPVNAEKQRRINKPAEGRRPDPVQPRKLGSRPDPTANRKPPRSKKPTAVIQKDKKITAVVSAEDESSTSSISGSSITTSADAAERSKAGEHKEDKKLLEGSDKLIHNIVETASDTQPSPVSVLDSSFYRDELVIPSPVTMKHNATDFKDHSDELEERLWSPTVSSIMSKHEEDCNNLNYISDVVIRTTHCFREVSDNFLLLEKQQYLKGKDMSKLSTMQRKVIFDVVNEILDRNEGLPPWSVMNQRITKPSVDEVWLEFQRIQVQNIGEDMFDTICGVLKKDLAGDGVTGWSFNQVEMSEMVLDIERLIFKDLIGESIRDMVALESRNILSSIKPRRKLAFL
ncbi:protein LONGIFOLIA 2-like [Andrographis paniculata]|uniref:protein LONGIFOLIA 2-like n=1 Tax=Andrographis paniculata TaxID=175694 RepID=UPI0021E8D421|nr:protein LONGIFOLIA 2-like [Andrographis paniculata]